MKNFEDRQVQQSLLGRFKHKFFEWQLARSLRSFATPKQKPTDPDKTLSAYERKKQQDTLRFRRIVGFISLVSFTGSVAFTMGQTLIGGFNAQPTANSEPSPAVQQQQKLLSAEEQGYVAVLKREPNNLVALDGLAATRIKAKNWKGAIEPLEKMVILDPNRQELKILLQEVKNRANQQ